MPVDRGDSRVLPGVYAVWQRHAAEAEVTGPVCRQYDPRFDPPECDYAAREADYQAALAVARRLAEARIAQGFADPVHASASRLCSSRYAVLLRP